MSTFAGKQINDVSSPTKTEEGSEVLGTDLRTPSAIDLRKVSPVWKTDELRGESTNLDVLRSIAVLLVFCCHYFSIVTGTGQKWGFLWHMGQLGVLIFFVHTCLVLMWSLERSSQGAKHLFAAFYVRRAMRIYPLSIAFVLFAYFFDPRWSPINLWQSITLTQYIFFKGSAGFPPLVTPLWSLPLEVEMYIALPLLYLIFKKRSLYPLLLTWLAAVGIAHLQPYLGDGFTIFKFVPCFLGGVIAWRLIGMGARQRLARWSTTATVRHVDILRCKGVASASTYSVSLRDFAVRQRQGERHASRLSHRSPRPGHLPRDARRRSRLAGPALPAATPAKAIPAPSARTRRRTSAHLAPRAIRTPISRVRRPTRHEITP